MPKQSTYWHCGGDILAHPCFVLTDSDARALRDIHLDEARAALAAKNRRAARQALRLAQEAIGALNGVRRWRRAAGPIRAASR
jgi:hypothetical protein